MRQGELWTWSFRDEAGRVLRQYDSVTPGQQNPLPTMWGWVEDYVYREGLLAGTERVAEEGGRRHFHLDHLGTPRLITGTGGLKVTEHEYYPFGNEITPWQATQAGFDREEPRKFTGHERDFNSGTQVANTNYLDYMHARYYNPSMGRFLSVDPIISKGAMQSPQLWNRYAYVGNNPMNRVDPDGRLLQLAGCANDANSSACKSEYNLYLSTFGKQSQEAAKYLQIGKNGIVGFKGISGAAFGAKFGTMGRASNFLISNRAATFSITSDASRVAPNSGGASTRYGSVGAEIAVNLGAFPNPQGGIGQTATGALAHELGHALGTLLPGIRGAFDAQLGNTMWTRYEGYGTAFENQWRREQGLEQRLFYKYMYGDVGHTSDDVFEWPTP